MPRKKTGEQIVVTGMASCVKAVKHEPNGLEVFLEKPRFDKGDYEKLSGMVDHGSKVQITITQLDENKKDIDGQQTFAD